MTLTQRTVNVPIDLTDNWYVYSSFVIRTVKHALMNGPGRVLMTVCTCS
jgi:hypothetical protein